MRALRVEKFGQPADCVLAELDPPSPGAGEVAIAVRAMGVNFPDLLVIGGRYQFLPDRPFTPGKEAAGVITALGPDVTGLAVGDRVSTQLEYGAFAEAIVAPAAQTYAIPQAMPFTTAAALGLTYQTAHFALLERGRFRPGETVLVTGASGGVGLAAVQLAKALGGSVLAGISNPEKAEAVLAAGADAIIDLGAEDLRADLKRQVLAASGDRGADVVIENVGGAVFEASLRALAWSGRLVVVGFAGGEIPSARANYILVKNITVTGLHWSDYRDRTPEKVAGVMAELYELWQAGKIDPHVMASYPLERFAEALDDIRHRRVVGKVVLTVGDGAG